MQAFVLQLKIKNVLIPVAVGEALTGFALLLVPSFVSQLLFADGLTGAGIVFGRIAGVALIALGAACWPGPPMAGMLVYSAVAALYLAFVGFAGGATGILLWPAVVLHVVLTVILAWSFARSSYRSGRER